MGHYNGSNDTEIRLGWEKGIADLGLKHREPHGTADVDLQLAHCKLKLVAFHSGTTSHNENAGDIDMSLATTDLLRSINTELAGQIERAMRSSAAQTEKYYEDHVVAPSFFQSVMNLFNSESHALIYMGAEGICSVYFETAEDLPMARTYPQAVVRPSTEI
ncbi:hypothetical protein RugamoR64_12690 [Duganella rhizosphaerae]